MKITYEELKRRVNEHALYVNDLSRFDNYLSHIKDEKLFLKDLQKEMDDLKKMISHFNSEYIFYLKIEKDDRYYLYKIDYNPKINIIIDKLQHLLENVKGDDLLKKSHKIVYGSEEKMNFYINVDIEYKNFNRIHIIDDLPYSFRNIGLGKLLYKLIIKKLGWISSRYIDSSKDSKFVWDSLSKDMSLYTCLKDKSIICFDSSLDVNIIENILRKWLKGADDYVLDTDMLKKYPDFDMNYHDTKV